MCKTKKVYAFLLIVTLISQFFPVFATEIDNGDVKNPEYHVVWECDFEEKKPDTENGTGYERYDEEHGRSLRMTSAGGGSSMKKVFDQKYTTGVLYVGYDLLKTGQQGRCRDQFLSEPDGTWGGRTAFIGSYWQGNSPGITCMPFANSARDTSARAAMFTPQTNVWHHLDLWIDLDNGQATYYFNGELLGDQPKDKDYGVDGIAAYEYLIEAERYGLTDLYLDNYKIYHFDSMGKPVNLESAMAVPAYLEAPVKLDITTDVLGNNFFDRENEISVQAKSLTGKDELGILNIMVTDDLGQTAMDWNEEITIVAREKNIYAAKCIMNRYGAYAVKTTFTQNGVVVSSDTTWVNRIKKAEKQNPEVGYSAHKNWGYGIQEDYRSKELFKNVGFTWERGPVDWIDTALKDGTFVVPARCLTALNHGREVGIRPLILLAGVGTLRPDLSEGEVPVSDWSRENFRKYVSFLAEANKDTHPIYEVFNETLHPNHEEYVLAQKVAYETIKSIDPQAIVLCGATPRVPLDWIEPILQAGAGKYFDGFSAHPYTSDNLPEDGNKWGTAHAQIDGLIELLDKYGLSDKEVYITELSYSSADGVATHQEQADFGLRQFIMMEDRMVNYIWYNDIEKGINDGFEQSYGMLLNADSPEIPYHAKPVILAWGAYNSLLTNATRLGRYDIGKQDEYVYRFVTEENRDVAVLWNRQAHGATHAIGLEIDTPSLELRDFNGNPTTIYPHNGVFNVEIGSSPIYLIGDFEEMKRCEPYFATKKNQEEIVAGEQLVIRYDNHDNLLVEAEFPDGYTMVSSENNEMVIDTSFEKVENAAVVLLVKNHEGKIVATNKVELSYVDPVTVATQVLAYNTLRYQASIAFTNQRASDISVSLTVMSPESLKGTYKINTISGKDTRAIKLNIPVKDGDNGRLELEGIATITNSMGTEQMPISIDKKYASIKWTDKKPVIDGILSPGEWETYLPMWINREDMANNMLWEGEKDCSAKVYLMSDEEYFYLAAEVTDDVYYDKDTADRVWANDSIQFAIATSTVAGSGSCELGLGISNGEVVLRRYIAQGINDGLGDLNVYRDDTEYDVKRYENEKKSIYEIKIPWEELYGGKVDMRKMKKIYFSILVNDNDDEALGRGWLEFCGGIGSSKSVQMFMDLPIYKPKAK